MRNRAAIRLEPEDRARLESLVAGRNTPQKQVYRARIVLLTADGVGTMEIMRRTGHSKPTVWRWQERFVTAGVDGLLCDATRPPGKKPLAATLVKQVVEMTLHQKPPGATHWTSRSMARSAGIGVSSVQRIWRAHGLKPHLVKTFKLSNDPRFVEKLRDVVGLYISPPERALVLSVDEKTQIQALDRTQPGLPMKKGRAGTMTHDYKRHGTTTLFAALNVATGAVIGQCSKCSKRHRHQEFLRFLRIIDRQTSKRLDLHLIVDNYATHNHARVKAWLKKHPRFHLHFTPTSASWLNRVERFFGLMTEERIRRGAFTSVADLEAAIFDYLEHHNASPKPFIWKASANDIVKKVDHARCKLPALRWNNLGLRLDN